MTVYVSSESFILFSRVKDLLKISSQITQLGMNPQETCDETTECVDRARDAPGS